MRTYSEIQAERTIQELQKPIELSTGTKIAIPPQELLQIVAFLGLDKEGLTKARLFHACVEAVRRTAIDNIPKPTLADALLLLNRYGLIDRVKIDLLARLQEDRL